ncbi:uncharacterized protein LOC121051453 [Rosa chinensis]|uniref:uncharacterized protein LOC121051453 n=1 Tax=Rosa chinensis TaxID=74649 RepID=UPI001AD911AE|nr:uncharacterized protein LOC121051453 [Rosa chinensis]
MIENRAKNAQQYEGVSLTTRKVSEIGTSVIEDRLNKLTLLMDQVVSAKGILQACGVCSMQGHVTDQCPQLTERGRGESVNAIGGYQGNHGGPPRPRYDPYSNTYNPGWRDHPNFKWTNNENTQNPLGGNSNYDQIIEALTNSTQALVQGQQNHTKDIADLKRQMGQVVDFMTKFHESGKLPSNTIRNPKGGFEGTTN